MLLFFCCSPLVIPFNYTLAPTQGVSSSKCGPFSVLVDDDKRTYHRSMTMQEGAWLLRNAMLSASYVLISSKDAVGGDPSRIFFPLLEIWVVECIQIPPKYPSATRNSLGPLNYRGSHTEIAFLDQPFCCFYRFEMGTLEKTPSFCGIIIPSWCVTEQAQPKCGLLLSLAHPRKVPPLEKNAPVVKSAWRDHLL